MALVSEREQVVTAGPDHIELPGALPGFSGRSCKLFDPGIGWVFAGDS